MTLNLAAMVDVMMCLIIFFLLASRLASAQYRGVDLPQAASAHEIERSEIGAKVVINVRPAADGVLDAEYVVQGWDGRRATERVLAADAVADYLHAKASQAVEHGETLSCVIRADRDVPYAGVETVLRGCGLARISRIVLSAQPDEPGGESSR
jgi:biopolymer transport protein ExbD